MLPAELVAVLEQKARDGWTGTLSLNFKDGRVLGYEVAEKKRLAT